METTMNEFDWQGLNLKSYTIEPSASSSGTS